MKETLLSIQAKLQTVSEIQFVDEDWGQLENYSAHAPVKFPCALLSVSGADYSDMGQDRTQTPVHRQMASGSIVLKIATLKLTNTSGKAPLSQKVKAWEIWDIDELAHAALQGFKPVENSGQMIRTNMRVKMRDDGIQEHRITYTFGQTDV